MIPVLLEDKIQNGQATYKTLQIGAVPQWILPVTEGKSVVIIGIDFQNQIMPITNAVPDTRNASQCLIFTNQEIFYPFTFDAEIETVLNAADEEIRICKKSQFHRDTYIRTSKDIAISFAFPLQTNDPSFNVNSAVLNGNGALSSAGTYSGLNTPFNIRNWHNFLPVNQGNTFVLTRPYTVPFYTTTLNSGFQQLYYLPQPYNVGAGLQIERWITWKAVIHYVEIETPLNNFRPI